MRGKGDLEKLNDLLAKEGTIPKEEFVFLLRQFNNQLKNDIVEHLEDDYGQKKVLNSFKTLFKPGKEGNEELI